jgi:hypothetical protein
MSKLCCAQAQSGVRELVVVCTLAYRCCIHYVNKSVSVLCMRYVCVACGCLYTVDVYLVATLGPYDTASNCQVRL